MTVGDVRLEFPPASSGDTRVAEEATVVEDAAMVDVKAKVVEVNEANVVEAENALVVAAAMAGLLVLFGKRDSLSLSIFYTMHKKNILKQKIFGCLSSPLRLSFESHESVTTREAGTINLGQSSNHMLLAHQGSRQLLVLLLLTNQSLAVRARTVKLKLVGSLAMYSLHTAAALPKNSPSSHLPT